MKFKRILSAFAAVTMALSAFNFTYAEDTTTENNVVMTENFKTYNDGYTQSSSSTYKHDKTFTRTTDGTGSFKMSVTGNTPAINYYVVNADTGKKLVEGEAYLFKAYVYGERISKGTATANLSYMHDALTIKSDTTIPIKQGEWTELSMYFIAGSRVNLTSDYNIWKKKMIIEFNDTTAGTVADNTCDIIYLDDISIEKASNADIVIENTNLSLSKFDKSVTLKYGFASLDVAKTKNVLTPGGRTNLRAYLQDGASGTTAAQLKRTIADSSYITAVSSDSAVASYENGEIVANGSGNAVLTYTYSDGTTTATAKQLITVSSNEANIVDTKYATIADPIDNTDTAKVPVYSKNIDLGIAANTPAVVSYRIYFNGRNAIGLPANCLGRTAILFSGKTSEYADVHGEKYEGTERMSYFRIGDNYYPPNGGKRDLPINSGWNNIDFVTEYPTENSYDDGYMKVSLYVNGNMSYSTELKFSEPSKNIFFTSTDNCAVIMDDLTVVSIKEPLSVKSTNPANGKKLSTLDDIDIEFNQAPSISDITNSAELFYGQEKIETVNTFHSEKHTLSVRPVNGLKPNLKYTLKLNRELIKTNSGEELTGNNEFSFTTDSVKVSDVIGSGYTLLNSQYDMIRNGSYKVSDKGEMVTEKDGSLVLRLPNEPEDNKDNSVSVSAEDSFLATKDAEKIIVEFDTKVETTEENPNNYEYAVWSVNGINADNQVGTLTQLGKARWGSSRAFNVLWSYLTVDPKTDTKIVTNPKNERGDEYGIYFADANFKLDNKGYAHVKIVYDLNQKDLEGDVAQTIYMTCDGKEYQYKTDKSTITVKYNKDGATEIINDITSIAGISLSMNQITVDRTAYLKNVNMYAVKADPNATPNAELTVAEFTNEASDIIESADQLNNTKIYFDVYLTNNKFDKDPNYTLIVAAYDKDTNKLIDMKYQSGTVAVGDTVQFESTPDTALDLTGFTSGTAEIKVFAWNSLSGAVPLVDSYTLQL